MTLERRRSLEAALAAAKLRVHELERALEPQKGDPVELLSNEGWLPATFEEWVADGLGFTAWTDDGRLLTCGRNNYRLPPLPPPSPPELELDVDRDLSRRAEAAGITWWITYAGAHGRTQHRARVTKRAPNWPPEDYERARSFDDLADAYAWTEAKLRALLGEGQEPPTWTVHYPDNLAATEAVAACGAPLPDVSTWSTLLVTCGACRRAAPRPLP